MATNAATYKGGYDSFVHSPQDAQENIYFYRTWCGLKAVLLSLGQSDPYKAPINVHTLCCLAHDTIGDYDLIRKSLNAITPKEPEAPRHYYCWHISEPSNNVETRAKSLFIEQYRIVFKGKRIGTKHYNAQWELKQVRAMEIAQKEYDDAMTEYHKRLSDRDFRDTIEQGEYRANCEEVRLALEFIAKLAE